ncbi:S-norcoclaurine synthase 1-like isoform X2 [Cannabis sativa]|uniref:S-norcoclaurine synthase 1-like isoform X2 n=1 Tax=Cannabis sativa TaxID=3483 RepID=UPI0029CA89B4|nr:S-norcoclaurine synthase 1-like isoform X2 [Cannabis sativa]
MKNTQQLSSVDYGGSLPVECVQDLASKNQTKIPPRYLRPEVELKPVSVLESFEFPVIDMTKLMIGDNQHQWHHDELAKLHLACKGWGFFQLINHGVSEEVIQKMKNDIEEFFKLPLVTKKAYAQQPNSIEGYGQAYVQSEHQKLDWGDMLFIRALPLSHRNMRCWPMQPISFRENLDNYSREVQKVAVCVMKFMSRNLGLNSETLASKFEDGRQGMRINYYPPCVEADKVIGLTPHSDATGLTLLLQVNDVQGLQIKKNGKWIVVKPVPGAFIVNIGDIIEIMSNGEYKSTEHRAVVNPEKKRISIAAFHGPNIKGNIGPLPDVVKKSKAMYKTISSEDYLRFIVNNKLDGKSRLDHLKLE